MIIPFGDRQPHIASEVFVAPDAWVIGAVEIAAQSSVFFHAVLRGDLEPISIGTRTNIQDHCMIHTTKGRNPVSIGDDVTVGHRATIHSATIRSRSLIGMGAIILDKAVIEEECLVGAGALVTEGKHFPPRSLIIGSPAKAVRTLSTDEVEAFLVAATRYVGVAAQYTKQGL